MTSGTCVRSSVGWQWWTKERDGPLARSAQRPTARLLSFAGKDTVQPDRRIEGFHRESRR